MIISQGARMLLWPARRRVQLDWCSCCSSVAVVTVVELGSDDYDNATPHRDNEPVWTIIIRGILRTRRDVYYWIMFKIGGDNVCDDYLRDTGRRNNNNNNMQRRYYCGCVAYIYDV